MEIILATNNQHKKEEIQAILNEHKILTPSDLNINFQCEEDGKSYFENSYKKAATLYALTNKIVLADDSGLSVEALGGAPGIYSARYGSTLGLELSDAEKMDKLLNSLENKTNRRAYFVSNIVLYINPYRFYSVQETLEGEIANCKKGTNGFGYDPIFVLPDCKKHLAELAAEEKNAISHRGKAVAQIKKLLSNL